MDFNKYYKLNTDYNKPPIKKEISKLICDIIKEKRNIGHNIIEYFRNLCNGFFDPNSKNTRSLYKNKTYTELRKNVIDAIEKITRCNYTIPALAEGDENKRLTDTLKKSVYKILNRKSKKWQKEKVKKKNKKGIKVK